MKPFYILILSSLFSLSLFAQQKEITGTIMDEFNEPLIGATVRVKNSNNAVITNLDGKYTIKATADDILVFSYLGFQNSEREVKQQTNISLQLQAISVETEEVVVVGYGKQRKIDMTGSISTLSAEEINRFPVSNVLEALSGKVSGVEVISNSEPGASPTVRIRGVGSYGETAPICVIDGQFYEIAELLTISPSDIENLSILKDASATAIYGSRGANGVIIVTTKQGADEKGKVRVTASMYFSASEMLKALSVANTSEWQRIENLSFLADNYNDPAAKDKLPYPDWQNAGTGTDWQKLITRTAFTHNYNASVAGSSEKTEYYLGVTYHNEEGIIKYNDYNRFTGKVNVSFKPVKWIKLGINSTFMQDDRTELDRNVFSLAGKRQPMAPIYNEGITEGSEENFNGGDNNPYALLYYTHDRYNKSWKYLNNYYAEISFLKDLVFKASISTTKIDREVKVFLPAFMEDVPNTNSEYKISRFRHNESSVSSWLQENTLTYNLLKNKHRMTAVGGFTLQSERTQYSNLSATDLPWGAWKNRNLWYVGQGKNITGADGGSERTYASFLARVNYTYNDRYTATLTGRIDGSSAYPKNKRYGYFPAIGIAWIANEESFLKDKKWLDMLKVKASYGVVGSDRGVSAAQMLYANAVDVVMGGNSNIEKADALKLMIDQSLTWEESKTLNLGFETAIFKNLLNVTVDYYNKTTSSVMMPLNIPPSNIKVISNIGRIRNQGIEASVNYSPKIGKVNANLMFTATTVNSKVIKINENVGPISALPNMTIEGYPIGGFWGLKTIGVFQNEEQLAQLPKVNGSRVGDLIFWDRNEDGVIDNRDNAYLGSYIPKAILGFTARASYMNFTLNVELNSSLGHKTFNRRMQYRQQTQNYATESLKAWHGEGTTNTHPRVFYRGDASSSISDYFIENADYLSLGNIQLAYNIPRKQLKKLGLSNLRVFFNCRNVYTWTKATGYSPDISPRGNNANSGGLDDFGQYPLVRSYTAGLGFSF